MDHRTEHDLIGSRQIPAEALWGIHTLRAVENFPLSGRRVHAAMIHAYGQVKLACARTNRALGAWAEDSVKADAIELACTEMAAGTLDAHILIDALAGGAGTSLNMNANEVLANRAQQVVHSQSEIADLKSHISPLNDLNLHQSTNDTFPTALKVAAMVRLHELEQNLVALQEAFQVKEKQFADVVKVGRTELQDAVLITLGREFSAYAEAINRDRWRIYKCNERLRVVNLGGTAIGTGMAAPRQYIFRVTDELRAITGLNLARAENLVDATQNADVFAEVSGILKACATNLIKICNDLRLLSSGPQAGLGEIILPPRQAGSSIMPGKVNPVIPEAVIQAAMRVIGLDASLTFAVASGNLELNAFLPLVADCLLEAIDLLSQSCLILRAQCVIGIEANVARCRAHVHDSTAVATALVSTIGHERMCQVVKKAKDTNRTVKEVVLIEGLLSSQQFDELTSPEAVCRLGQIRKE